jgi:hypothetical protein
MIFKKFMCSFTVLIQDVTYLALKENTHVVIVVLGRQKTIAFGSLKALIRWYLTLNKSSCTLRMRNKKAKFGKILKIKSLSYILDRMIPAKTISCYCPFNYVIILCSFQEGEGIGENGGGQPGGGGGGGVNRGRPKKNVKKDANLQGIVGDYNSLNKAQIC